MPLDVDLDEKWKRLNVDSDDDETEDGLVIGIDFGTTYSGAAWATRHRKTDVRPVISWPGKNQTAGKVPTEIWYGDDEQIEWGYEVPVDEEPFRWFKLLLLHTEDLSPELHQSGIMARSRAMMKEHGKTAEDLVTDYLRLFWKHIVFTIERALGPDEVKGLPFHVVLTVPAIWKGYARQAMEQSVKDAGILDYRLAGATKLTLVTEPEAAAMPTLLEQGSGVRSGNVYIICDAGGGTVDLISYKVQSTKPVVLQEVVEGTGGLCGGIFIDQAFKSICSGRLGPKWKWKDMDNDGRRSVMNDWEYFIKPEFSTGKAGKKYIVAFPSGIFGRGGNNDISREPHIKKGRIYFSEEDIKRAFEDVFTEIQRLIEQQITKAAGKGLSVTGIILVGGLGASPYLYQYLQTIRSKFGTSILQSDGMKPRTAMCRGAVLKGFLEDQKTGYADMPIRVESTISRASYGISFYAPWDPLKHLVEDKEWSIRESKWIAQNQMHWYLRRGQVVSTLEPVRASWRQCLYETEFDGTLSIQLYECGEEVPPERLDLSVRRLGTLKCVIDAQYSELPEHNHNKEVKVLEYELEMVPSGASVNFMLYIQGRRQGVGQQKWENEFRIRNGWDSAE